jgi:hypothetical protein
MRKLQRKCSVVNTHPGLQLATIIAFKAVTNLPFFELNPLRTKNSVPEKFKSVQSRSHQMQVCGQGFKTFFFFVNDKNKLGC